MDGNSPVSRHDDSSSRPQDTDCHQPNKQLSCTLICFKSIIRNQAARTCLEAVQIQKTWTAIHNLKVTLRLSHGAPDSSGALLSWKLSCPIPTAGGRENNGGEMELMQRSCSHILSPLARLTCNCAARGSAHVPYISHMMNPCEANQEMSQGKSGEGSVDRTPWTPATFSGSETRPGLRPQKGGSWEGLGCLGTKSNDWPMPTELTAAMVQSKCRS